MAHDNGALRPRDLACITVDTKVQPKNISFPTDAKPLHAAIRGLNALTFNISDELNDTTSLPPSRR